MMLMSPVFSFMVHIVAPSSNTKTDAHVILSNWSRVVEFNHRDQGTSLA